MEFANNRIGFLKKIIFHKPCGTKMFGGNDTSSCFSHEQKKQSNRWWVPEKKDVISWEKLDTIVVGEGLFKLEYPDCFELSEESDTCTMDIST